MADDFLWSEEAYQFFSITFSNAWIEELSNTPLFYFFMRTPKSILFYPGQIDYPSKEHVFSGVEFMMNYYWARKTLALGDPTNFWAQKKAEHDALRRKCRKYLWQLARNMAKEIVDYLVAPGEEDVLLSAEN